MRGQPTCQFEGVLVVAVDAERERLQALKEQEGVEGGLAHSEVAEAFQLLDLDDQLRDFRDTAALIASLDLVVGVDTSVPHLAGALGVTTALLLPVVPEWRWMQDRPDSPWYPRHRLFRQPRLHDWAAPVSALAAWLRASGPDGVPRAS